jgi:hypothetical protein
MAATDFNPAKHEIRELRMTADGSSVTLRYEIFKKGADEEKRKLQTAGKPSEWNHGYICGKEEVYESSDAKSACERFEELAPNVYSREQTEIKSGDDGSKIIVKSRSYY